MFPGIAIGTYVGSHGSNNKRNSNNYSHANIIEDKKDRVIKILRHGDHWHIYTSSGQEYISYSDPSSKYPDAEVGEYVGNHGSSNDASQDNSNSVKPNVPSATDKLQEAIKNLNIVTVLGKNPVDRYDIVKILKHEDHYHIYDSKGNEGITYTNPSELYPNAEFGEYVGNHGDDNEKPFEWPKGVTKIVDHGDHWHLYIDDKEIGVVHENPKEHYPDAEYIKETNDHADVTVDENELFTYESVKAELKDYVIPYLDNNLKAMRAYGDLNTTLSVYGSNGETKGIFYWLHGNHYHAITIKQIIQNAKSGQYGNCTAKDIVAAIKYIIQNPNVDIESKITVDTDEVLKYLRSYYNLEDDADAYNIGNMVYVYINEETFTFSLTDFEKVDGKIRYKKQLPEAPAKPEPTDEEVEEENRNDYSDYKEEKDNIKETSNKEEKIEENNKENSLKTEDKKVEEIKDKDKIDNKNEDKEKDKVDNKNEDKVEQ